LSGNKGKEYFLKPESMKQCNVFRKAAMLTTIPPTLYLGNGKAFHVIGELQGRQD